MSLINCNIYFVWSTIPKCLKITVKSLIFMKTCQFKIFEFSCQKLRLQFYKVLARKFKLDIFCDFQTLCAQFVFHEKRCDLLQRILTIILHHACNACFSAKNSYILSFVLQVRAETKSLLLRKNWPIITRKPYTWSSSLHARKWL